MVLTNKMNIAGRVGSIISITMRCKLQAGYRNARFQIPHEVDMLGQKYLRPQIFGQVCAGRRFPYNVRSYARGPTRLAHGKDFFLPEKTLD